MDDLDEAERRWQAVLARSRAADGTFVFSVASTGVYCRPSCPARRARRENVRFHTTPAEAARAGFRPCRRCRPDETERGVAIVAASCRRIEAAEAAPRLAELAAEAGLSPGHFHRLFRARTGVTPRAYAEALRAGRVRGALGAGHSVTEALHEAGFGASSRFYAAADATLGMTPTRFRTGGAGETLQVATGPCSLGLLLVAHGARGVAAILLGEDAGALRADLARQFPRAVLTDAGLDGAALLARVVAGVEQPGAADDLPLDIRGTSFQRRVWQALRGVPAGQTASYAEIARRIGEAGAARAVGAACGANAHAVVIACHRAVRSDGALAGYRWGKARKQAILERERQSSSESASSRNVPSSRGG